MSENVNSILAVDFGSISTRAVLIDVVDGAYRLVSRGETRSTDGFPAYDIRVGLDRVFRQITDATDRQFITETGQVITPEQDNRDGADLFAVTASIGRPLRVVVVGLAENVSIKSAMHAANGTYMEVPATISLEDGRDEEARLNAVVLSYPDVIFIVGGTEAGAESSVRRLATVTANAVELINKQRRPVVVYSGNSSLDATMLDLFEPLTQIYIAGNIRPSLDNERLDNARLMLGQAFDRSAQLRGGGFEAISEMSDTGVLPAAQSAAILANYLGRTGADPVAVVDMGSSSTTLGMFNDGEIVNSIRTDVGLGHSVESLYESLGVDAVRRWLPFNISQRELTNYVLNKALRPTTIPATLRDLYIEHALLRAGLRRMINELNPNWMTLPYKTIIGAGGALTGTGNPGFSALLLLDAFQPIGVTMLQADPYGLVAAMGAIASYVPDAVVQLIDSKSLLDLACVFSADGSPRVDKPAFNVTISLESGEQIEQVVEGGHLWRYPLAPGRAAEIAIKCARGTSINGKRRGKLTLMGGIGGLIFDARGRPLPLASAAAGRAEQMPQWIHEVTGDPLIEIDPAWLETIEDDEVEVEVDAAPAKRRGLFGRRRDKNKDKDKDKQKRQEEPSDDELDALFGDKKDNDFENQLNELRDDVLS